MLNNGNSCSDDSEDCLRSINQLSTCAQPQAQAENSSPWLPLESNPEIFTAFARRVGSLPPEWRFVDVLGFDNDALQLVPRPVVAVILLFPCTEEIYAHRAQEKRKLLADRHEGAVSPAAKKAYHVKQVPSFGNACGTIAAIHSLTNADLCNDSSCSFETPLIAGPVAAFRESTLEMKTPEERGQSLVVSNSLHNLSDEAASNRLSQTECPDRGDTKLGHHYCSFVLVPAAHDNATTSASNSDNNTSLHVVELDGTKVLPVDHGPLGHGQDLLQAAAAVIRERWIRLEPGRIDFSLMALAKTA